MAIQAAGGGPLVMANYFHIALKGTARSWLMHSEHRGTPDEPAAPEHIRSGRPDNKKNKRKAATVLVAAEGSNKQQPGRALGGGAPRPSGGFQKLAPAKPGAGMWCENHRTDRHDLTECQLVQGLAEDHR
ncbi:hypothetical protein C2845_PM01G44050 [Panicum miliaceum]|uniref:Uncharacterized protein n=1 Tax=Panicum miliaceum TaxID=4540 RepID=A0A3L6TS03_PANMI|nr:hypothetical protein C2845_PM01G44050 [Panicum miliaceum]